MNTQRLDALLKSFTTMERGVAGCALNVSIKGKTAYEGYCGMADIEAGRAIGPDTLYRLYSSGKVVTAVAMMMLLERGYYLLDDPIAKYLPEFKDAQVAVRTGNNMQTLRPAKALTVKHFLTMTTGLTYGGNLSSTHDSVRKVFEEIDASGGCSTRVFSRMAASVPLLFEPGTSWNYGINLDVLGAFIEVVTDKTFGQFLQDELYAPLGMTDSVFFVDEARKARLAKVYTWDEKGRRVVNSADDYKFDASYRFESGGGGMISSLSDQTRFARMLSMGGELDGVRILGRKTIDLMRQNHLCPEALAAFRATHENGWSFMAGYGYGLGVKTLLSVADANCSGTVGEFSWAGAAGTLTLIDPVEQMSVVYMQQQMPGNREETCHPLLRNVIYGLLD